MRHVPERTVRKRTVQKRTWAIPHSAKTHSADPHSAETHMTKWQCAETHTRSGGCSRTPQGSRKLNLAYPLHFFFFATSQRHWHFPQFSPPQFSRQPAIRGIPIARNPAPRLAPSSLGTSFPLSSLPRFPPLELSDRLPIVGRTLVTISSH